MVFRFTVLLRSGAEPAAGLVDTEMTLRNYPLRRCHCNKNERVQYRSCRSALDDAIRVTPIVSENQHVKEIGTVPHQTTSRPLTWQETFSIRTTDIDCLGRAAPAAVGRCLQEAAIHHARHLRVAFDDLAPRGLTWVLTQLDLRISHWPQVDDRLAITTWPSGADTLFAYRQFIVRNETTGEESLRAATAWALLNMESRRPVRMPSFITEIENPALPDAVENPFPRLRTPRNAMQSIAIPVLRGDMDLNRHVNNTRYLAWLMEAVPDAAWEKGMLRTFHIQYRAEARHGDPLSVEADIEQETDTGVVFRHALLRSSDQRLLALGRSAWDF